MSDDASLTDFAGGGDSDKSEDSADERDASEGVERAENAETPTYTSTPDGAECDACGEIVEERWHAGEGGTEENPDLSPDALVCPDCKEW